MTTRIKSDRERCAQAVTRALRFITMAQAHAPRQNTGRIQFERRILRIREELSELRDLLNRVPK